jgi:hypothetical protein
MRERTNVLRLFYRALTRHTLPDAPAVGRHPDYTQATLGHAARLYYDRGDLMRELDRHDLYPHQLHPFVEGDSEDVVFPSLIGALLGPAEAEGLKLTNLPTCTTMRGFSRRPLPAGAPPHPPAALPPRRRRTPQARSTSTQSPSLASSSRFGAATVGAQR